MDGVFMVGTLDNLQIQPIDGRPLHLEHSIIPCINYFLLRRSTCASGDRFFEL